MKHPARLRLARLRPARLHPARLRAASARSARLGLGTALLAGAALIIQAAGAVASAPAQASPAVRAAAARPVPASARGFRRPACAAARPGQASCFLLYRQQYAVNRAIAAGQRGAATGPVGLSARAIERAYRLPVSRRSHQTVAVSIAFNTPHLARYLNAYRQHFGLPPCRVASGCFRKVNEHGKASPLPPSGAGSGWDLEATLDVSMISVTCPYCKILVVEANDPGLANLAASENAAARLGAQVITNSYGASENGFALAYSRDYRHPGHTIVASAGDYGYTAANFPADLAAVTAVGGTELRRAHTKRGWREAVWNSDGGAGGSGCSAYVAKPAWQHDRHCPGRTVADVAAVADNIPIFNTYWGGWITVAGTSVSAPLIAGVYGLAGNASAIGLGYAYRHRGSLFDITSGNNSVFVTSRQACGDDYLCVAKRGYDGPTGLGTPDGTGAF